MKATSEGPLGQHLGPLSLWLFPFVSLDHWPNGQVVYLTYLPFTTSDLYNWKMQNPPFCEKPYSHKRTVVATYLHSSVLGMGIAIGTGTRALALQDQNYRGLHQAIDSDLQELEKFISYLQDSLSSLANVTLQSRQGLLQGLHRFCYFTSFSNPLTQSYPLY